MHPKLSRLAIALLFAGALDLTPEQNLTAQTSTPEIRRQDVPKEVDAFVKRPQKEQLALVESLTQRLAALDNPWFRALRQAAQAAATASEPRTDAFPRREAGKRAPKPDPRRITDLPQQRQYVFGLGIIEGPPEPPKKKRDLAKFEAELRKDIVQTALMGMPLEAEAAVAELLRRLDHDSAADRFAAFLECWRNGSESFYQALDRTAGTQASVFFYDAMLGDFTSTFAKTPEQKATLAGLDNAHDALHDGFLSYRQYRAFREAMAWSMVLPPQSPLPKALERYEAKVAGAYSLREQVQMVLATCDWDPCKLIEKVKATAEPLPTPIWSQQYDPYPKWNELFFAAMETMIEQSGNTDVHLQKARDQMRAWCDEVRSASTEGLGAAPTPR